MSRLFERPLRGLLMVLLVLSLVPAALAQGRDENSEQGEEAASSAGERKRPMISTGLGSEAIAREWPEAAVWLELPDNSRVLALFEPETGARAKGALVVLADESQSAASGLAGALRRPMAKAGWAVLAVGLEPAPYAVQQARRQQEPDSAGGPGDEGDAGDAGGEEAESVMIDVMDNGALEDLAESYRTRVQETLAAAADYLADRDYSNLTLVGVGRGADHVTRRAVNGGSVAALVWVAPEFEPDQSPALPKRIGDAGSLRVLELHSSRRQADDRTNSSADRAAAFRRAGVERYTRQTVAMAGRPEARDAPALANRMASWLESVQ